MMEKRGAVTVHFIVWVVLILVGLVILLVVYANIGFGGLTDDTVCHESVIFRATLPAFGGINEYVPLKCKTEKTCVTSGLRGGECEDFKNVEGITKAKVDNTDEIEKVIAQNLVNCWTTMGEGKVSLFTQWGAENLGFGSVYPSCTICDRIAFDKETLAKKDGVVLSEIDVLDYMNRHKPVGKDVSYTNYFVGEGGKFNVGKNLNVVEFDKKIKEEISKLRTQLGGSDLSDEDKKALKQTIEQLENAKFDALTDVQDNLDSDEIAIIFMQISAPDHVDSLINLGLAVVGVGAVSSFVSTKPIATVGRAVGRHPVVAAILIIGGAGVQVANVARNREVTAGYCGDISIGTEARNGCSAVRVVNYNVEDISKYCAIIESIP